MNTFLICDKGNKYHFKNKLDSEKNILALEIYVRKNKTRDFKITVYIV